MTFLSLLANIFTKKKEFLETRTLKNILSEKCPEISPIKIRYKLFLSLDRDR